MVCAVELGNYARVENIGGGALMPPTPNTLQTNNSGTLISFDVDTQSRAATSVY